MLSMNSEMMVGAQHKVLAGCAGMLCHKMNPVDDLI